jgi:RNA polymerase sigma factor (sigma-70 family)
MSGLEAVDDTAHLIESQLETVKRIAGHIFHKVKGKVEYDDLIGAGNLALVQCIGSYDPSRASLKTFVSRRVFGAMIDFLRLEDPASRNRRKELGPSFQISQQFADEADETGLKLSELHSCFIDPQAAAIRSNLFDSLNAYPTDNPRDRTVLVMAFVEDKRQEEIAKELDVSPGRVSQIIANESSKLRAHLKVA